MPYTPTSGDEGTQLLLSALRDFIRSDTASGGVVPLLPAGTAGVLPEGFLTNETLTPAIVIADLGYGEAASGGDVRLVRYIVYAIDRGRGYYNIDRLIYRLGKLLNGTEAALNYLTFPSAEPLMVLSLKAPGATATASYPGWKAEGKGLYLFVEVRGLLASE